MLQTIWDWIIFLYVEEFVIPALNNPVPFYLVVSLISLLVISMDWVNRRMWW